jgi:ribosomal protein S18 acetylase RimI-like enzyme
MSVRRLTPGEEGEVLRATSLFDEPPDPAAVQSYLRDNQNIFLLAYEGDEPVGFLRGTELSQLKSEQKQMFLYEMAVNGRARRRGFGRELIQ